MREALQQRQQPRRRELVQVVQVQGAALFTSLLINLGA